MLELSSALETEIVVAGLVAMLGMAVWLLFRDESNGEKSLFLKIMSPYDGENETPSLALLYSTSKGRAKVIPTTCASHMSHLIKKELCYET
ncbi:MAG: hypothetical protein NPIRA04_28190 [Nitrospirales bacterium]|nr:MAG: hypothetical protein NPIRA04_28190 [Nitrospirales bacterium]